jgi:hypothetical protein
LAGEEPTGNRLAQIYRNLGNGTFTNINAGLPGLAYGAVAWKDYDRDGQPDLLLSGITSGNTSSCLLYQNEHGVFKNANAGLLQFSSGSVDWGDYNNDGAPTSSCLAPPQPVW